MFAFSIAFIPLRSQEFSNVPTAKDLIYCFNECLSHSFCTDGLRPLEKKDKISVFCLLLLSEL